MIIFSPAFLENYDAVMDFLSLTLLYTLKNMIWSLIRRQLKNIKQITSIEFVNRFVIIFRCHPERSAAAEFAQQIVEGSP